ncbi:hypothetical protein CORC01_07303 [Colletotrichum orchidophilum]|uniref:Uncharacterized protein n=1 Tax=Colletotrichum orchidophilum TaxID=1209926 RepID=A0A1G4B7G9_9PEZI|nr:uncharacterized protein CORC01_07303 [Colletotrichum orchidophilum]OHE97398.1 hypothetical protein CORC01_07303 [Colletotrichum orchidophilum]
MLGRTAFPSAAPQAFVTASAIRQSPPSLRIEPPFSGLHPPLWPLRPGRDASPDLSTASCTQDYRSSSNVGRSLPCCKSHSTPGPITIGILFSTGAAPEHKMPTAPLLYHYTMYSARWHPQLQLPHAPSPRLARSSLAMITLRKFSLPVSK